MIEYRKLVEFHRKHSLLQSGLNDDELCAYFMALDYRKNLIYEFDLEGNVIGLFEFWRVNYEQLGKIVIHGYIDAREEDTVSGDIAFVANIMVHPDYRGKEVFKSMKVKYFLANYNCKFFAGDSRRKKHHKSFNIYKRTDLISKYSKEGE